MPQYLRTAVNWSHQLVQFPSENRSSQDGRFGEWVCAEVSVDLG